MALRAAALAGAALLTTLMLSGCGQKGPLYLPSPSSAATPTTAPQS